MRYKRYKLRKYTNLANTSLTNDEKLEIIRLLNESHDHDKILFNIGKKKIMRKLQKECLIILYYVFISFSYINEFSTLL